MPARRFSDEQEQSMVSTYASGVSAREISQRLDCAPNTVLYILHKHGVDTGAEFFRRNFYSFNFQAFDDMNREEAAYWLGFIFADGHVATHPSRLTINLQARDMDHLEQLRNWLKLERPVKTHVRRDGFQQSQLRASNPHFTNRLAEMGIYVGKSDITIPASFVPREMFHHFVRGFFDGDGSAQINEPRIQFVGVMLSMAWLQSRLADLAGTNPNGKIQPCKGSTKVFTLNYAGKLQVAKLAAWLYADATIYLNRKYEILSSY